MSNIHNVKRKLSEQMAFILFFPQKRMQRPMCFFKCCDNLAYGDGDHYRVKKIGSISVSGQLPTHPSPNPTLTLTCCQLTIVELGEG